MDERRKIARELDEIQQELKEIEILYEQYFAGLERREPHNRRKTLARRLRHFTNRHIVWTDLKFRYQGIASRFMSYSQYWDRILRLMDEGKYHRHTAKLAGAAVQAPKPEASSPGNQAREASDLHEQLTRARQQCGLSGNGPSAERVAEFLASQREKIRSRYGDQPVQFSIDTSEGKPRIKVSLKK